MSKLTILLYHGVTNTISKGIENFSFKHIPDSIFLEQMTYIKKHCNVLSINDVVDIHKNKEEYPEKAVLVSFDDGFENNYSVAAPILDRLNIPAVFYITSGIINTDIMFWVDKIENCINHSKNKHITISDIGSFDLTTPENKINAVVEIKRVCKLSNSTSKNKIINEVIAETNISPNVSYADNYKKMSWVQLKEMHNNDLFEIGGHSLYHDILSALPYEKMYKDIKLSIDLLEYNLNAKIDHYSYPEGKENHYNEDTINVLKELGIVCSPSAIHGYNHSVDEFNLFNLRRVMVGFMGQEFPDSF